MDNNKIYWVRGNTQELLIPLEQEIVPQEGDVDVVPYYPDQDATVTVRLVGKYRKLSYTPIVDGNLLRVTDNGAISQGVYGVEILVDNPDGTHYRSLWDNQIVVTNANDSVLQEWDEFRQLDVKARAALFFFAKGDKGEKGDRGEQGIQGERGEQGIQGEKGEKGDTGEKGDKGDKGDTGTTDYNDLENKPDLSIYMQQVTQEQFDEIFTN